LKHAQEGIDRPQQCAYVFVQQIHFVDEHEDKKHDAQYLYAGRMSLGTGTCPPQSVCMVKIFFIELAFNKTLKVTKFLKHF
jgi:hypothetical protein